MSHPHTILGQILVLLSIFLATAQAVQVEISDPGNVNQISLDDTQSLDDASKRTGSGFVRIGRQGNFIRIGRPSSFVRIGRRDSLPYWHHKTNDKSIISRDRSTNRVRAMRWYPHLHRFIRIGRNGNKLRRDDESPRDSQASSDPHLEANVRMDENKGIKRNFVRIGRPLTSQPLAPHDNILKPGAQETKKGAILSKRMQGFVRIGRSTPDSVFGVSDLDHEKLPTTWMNNFLKQNRDTVADPYTLDGPNDDKRPSGFVRIGRTFYTPSFADLTSQKMGNPLNWKLKSAFGKIGNAGLENSLAQEGRDEFGQVYFNDDYGNFTEITSPRSGDHKTSKRAAGFVRIGKQAFDPTANFIGHSNSIPGSRNRIQYLNQRKRSSSLVKAPESADDMKSGTPFDTANRRSAFVRIGKIPSSAFVRIGKNFDRILQLPVTNNRYYRRYLRKGQSSFVRIG